MECLLALRGKRESVRSHLNLSATLTLAFLLSTNAGSLGARTRDQLSAHCICEPPGPCGLGLHDPDGALGKNWGAKIVISGFCSLPLLFSLFLFLFSPLFIESLAGCIFLFVCYCFVLFYLSCLCMRVCVCFFSRCNNYKLTAIFIVYYNHELITI